MVKGKNDDFHSNCRLLKGQTQLFLLCCQVSACNRYYFACQAQHSNLISTSLPHSQSTMLIGKSSSQTLVIGLSIYQLSRGNSEAQGCSHQVTKSRTGRRFQTDKLSAPHGDPGVQIAFTWLYPQQPFSILPSMIHNPSRCHSTILDAYEGT